MEIKYITESDIYELAKKKIYIYGAGSLANMVKAKLKSFNLCETIFCVDREYVNGKYGVISLDECVDEIKNSDAFIFIGIGTRNALEKLSDKGINHVYAVYDPYNFWEYKDVPVRKLVELLSNLDYLYDDELSKETCMDYIDSIRTGNGVDESKNCVEYAPYFNEITENIGDGAYIDVGAYTGDTIDSFENYYGRGKHEIIALEPDEDSFRELENKYRGITLYKKGAWNQTGNIGFISGKGQRSEVSENSKMSIEVVKLDEIVGENKTSFIKIGTDFSKEILQGSEEIIKRDFPIVVMVAVFNFNLFKDIPSFFKNITSDEFKYNVYLRHHSIASCGLLFVYAIPERKR